MNCANGWKNPSSMREKTSNFCERFWIECRSWAQTSRIAPYLELQTCSTAYQDAAVADLMEAIRSSIKSRSTSQYLSAESSSLSGGSPPADSVVVFRP